MVGWWWWWWCSGGGGHWWWNWWTLARCSGAGRGGAADIRHVWMVITSLDRLITHVPKSVWVSFVMIGTIKLCACGSR